MNYIQLQIDTDLNIPLKHHFLVKFMNKQTKCS